MRVLYINLCEVWIRNQSELLPCSPRESVIDLTAFKAVRVSNLIHIDSLTC